MLLNNKIDSDCNGEYPDIIRYTRVQKILKNKLEINIHSQSIEELSYQETRAFDI